MKKSVYVSLGALVVSLGLTGGAGPATAQDVAAVAPKNVKVLVDNDRVRVLDVLDKPGEMEPMHFHPDFVTVGLGTTRIKVTTPDGKVVEKERKLGDAVYSGPVTHSIENIGPADFHVIVIELKK
ncbi:MAG TPA: cytoplasmic protein [bacterium]